MIPITPIDKSRHEIDFNIVTPIKKRGIKKTAGAYINEMIASNNAASNVAPIAFLFLYKENILSITKTKSVLMINSGDNCTNSETCVENIK